MNLGDMKRFISVMLTAAALGGLTACGEGEASTSSTPASASRSVPDVTGVTFLEARNILLEEGFRLVIVGKDGKKWTNIVPNETVTVESTDPVAGTASSSEEVSVTVNVSQDEFLAAGKAKAEAASAATRYDFQCGTTGGTQTTYKSYKEVWASTEYAGSSTCFVKVAGKVSWDTDKPSLIPSEQAIVDLVASKGGDVSVPISTVADVMKLCAKLDPGYAEQVVARNDWRKAEAEGALSICPDAPHAPLLQEALTAIRVGDGNMVVGSSIEPGTYKTKPGITDCYWSRTTGGGNIIANDFVGFAPDGVTVTVYPGEGFESERCAPWTKIG